MVPKTAVIGATGFIGKHFFAAHREIYFDCIGTTKQTGRDDLSFFDLSSPSIAHLQLRKTEHQDALILAGMTKLAECETEKAKTRKVNVDGVLELVRQLVAGGNKPIFFSSDIVFDGKTGLYDEESPLGPLNEYARQKAEVEAGIKSICRSGKYLIIHLCKTFSLEKGDGTLLDEMASLLKRGGTVRAAYDQIFCPINVTDLVDVVTLLQEKNVTGVINVSPPEAWSRYDLAVALARSMGEDVKRVERISLDDLKEPFLRPKNTSMRIERLIKEIEYPFPPTIRYIERIAENWRESGVEAREVKL